VKRATGPILIGTLFLCVGPVGLFGSSDNLSFFFLRRIASTAYPYSLACHVIDEVDDAPDPPIALPPRSGRADQPQRSPSRAALETRTIPREVWLGDARKAYPEDEVEQWINARIAERAVAAALAPANGAQHADQHEQDLPAAPMPSAAPHSAAAPLKRPRSRPPPGI
jgi:hypothetical protein